MLTVCRLGLLQTILLVTFLPMCLHVPGPSSVNVTAGSGGMPPFNYTRYCFPEAAQESSTSLFQYTTTIWWQLRVLQEVEHRKKDLSSIVGGASYLNSVLVTTVKYSVIS